MPEGIEGHVVVVTGGSSGIGRATAGLLVAGGARVALLARRRRGLEETVAELGPSAVPFVADVADPGSVRQVFGEIADRFGRVDALLNVAGAMQLKTLDACSDDDITGIVGVNYLGPIFTTRAALPLLRAAGGGDIINVSSEATLMTSPLMSMYTSSKAALESFTECSARELRAEGIRVCLVRVGHTATAIPETISATDLEVAIPILQQDGFYDRVGGPMDPDWVAETLLFALTRPRGQIVDVVHARSFR